MSVLALVLASLLPAAPTPQVHYAYSTSIVYQRSQSARAVRLSFAKYGTTGAGDARGLISDNSAVNATCCIVRLDQGLIGRFYTDMPLASVQRTFRDCHRWPQITIFSGQLMLHIECRRDDAGERLLLDAKSLLRLAGVHL